MLQYSIKMQNVDPPAHYLCSITRDVMQNPVIDHEGNSYEKEAIEKWLSINSVSPVTRSPLRLDQLIPNRGLQNAIEGSKWSNVAVVEQGNPVRAEDQENSGTVCTKTSIYTVERLNYAAPKSVMTMTSTSTSDRVPKTTSLFVKTVVDR